MPQEQPLATTEMAIGLQVPGGQVGFDLHLGVTLPPRAQGR
jgi:hypothetical protein